MAALHSSACRFAGQRLLLGRAVLYADRLEVKGWTWQGPIHLRIPLLDLEHVEWHTAPPPAVNLVLFLQDGHALPLCIKGAAIWKYTLAEHAPQLKQTTPALPNPTPDASVA